ncbi:cation:proton antiporter domain-containing protein [Halegenticoccus tardaugens]|uniref:cation:proton antiporter domain-containing protein n=1 Tax=Halegenticoccus tardaugens TaxID=2071624 RepID=UPI00100A8F15|nr:cation:proton antiporter [Halegenticoccus tardaugens]
MTTVVEPLGHHQLLLLFLQLSILLLVARGLGVLATRFDLPAVVGELLAGIVVGPSLFGAIAPGLFQAIFPFTTEQFHLLEVVSWIGLIMLIILTGLETDIDLIVNKAEEATYISIASIVVPFAIGFGFAWVLPVEFIAAPDQRLVFSLFVATAMSISAIPVIAKILMDMDVIRRDFGQITLAAGMINDTVGWILLALVAGLARTGALELGTLVETIIWLAVFLGVGFTVGQRAVAWIMRWVDTNIGGQISKITTLMVLALAVGSFTHYLHLEAVLGAFVVGILVGQVKRFDYETEHTFEVVTIGVFAPIFFATAGLRVDLTALFDPIVFAVTLGALAIAVVGKFVGSYAGAKLAGLSHWEGVTMGSGLNARGAMEIIVAIIGLGLGVLTIEMYSIIVVIAVVTSLMAPPLLRWSLSHVEMSEEERERIEREKRQQQSFVASLKRVLLPTRGGANTQFAAQLLGYISREEEIEVTGMYVSDANTDTDTAESRLDLVKTAWQRNQNDESAGIWRSVVREVKDSITGTVLREARQGYDLLVIGTSKIDPTQASDEPLFSSVEDAVIQESPCPVMVVSSHLETEPEETIDRVDVDRILLPTVGTEYNRHAAELAFSLARNRNAIVEIVHVVNPPQVEDLFVEQPDMEPAIEIGEEIVDREADLGRQMGAEVKTRVIVGEDEPEQEIVDLADENGDDLILLGSNLRPITQRVFFGHRTEFIIKNADCPVVVISSL